MEGAVTQGGAWSVWARTLRWLESQRRLAWWLSAIVLLLALGDAWAGRHSINPDGISYLDLGNTVFAHGIKAGASVAWSPAYIWIVGAAVKIFSPSRPHELILVMAVNLAIVGVLLVAFAWWLSELFALLRQRGFGPLIPESLLVLLAYAIVAWAILLGVTVTAVTPDMLLALWAFTAGALLMRIARLGGSALAWVGLGVVLGLGYLTKAGFVFPLVVACAAAAVLTRGSGARRMIALAVTFAACLCVAAPFIAVLSSKEGRLEVGSYGTLNYAWNVDGVTMFTNWTGGNGEFGRPLHPTLIASSPETFAYASPIAGSIPLWYDPVYWYAGVHAKPLVGRQVRTTAQSIIDTLHFAFVGPLILLFAPVLMLWYTRRRDHDAHPARDAAEPPSRSARAWTAIRRHAYLALPVAGIVTYFPLITLRRYIAAYIAMLAITWFMVVCGWRRREGVSNPMVDWLALATAVVAVITFAYASFWPLYDVGKQLAGRDAPGTVDLRVARALTRAGIGPGDGIAFVGEAAGVPRAYYARLDRARVVGNINDSGGAFWRLDSTAQTDRLSLLQTRSGARVAVSDETQARSASGWTPIAGTTFSYRRLNGG